MITEPFINENSLIHRLDPRVRLVFATLYSFAVAVLNQFPALAWALFLSFLLVLLARLNFREVGRRLAMLNTLLLFFWVALPLTFEGEPIFSIGPISATREGVLLSAQITLKSNAILLAFIALVATSPLATLGHAMNRLCVPEKIVHLLLLTYRYVFVIEQEYQRLIRAAKIRGFCPKTDIHTYRTYAYLIGMLFVRASARAERVHQAMVCRGFKGKFYCLSEFSLTRLDVICSAFMVAAIIGLEMLEWFVKIT
ncbi:cobalt ECF transporter T component CbiQ [Desulfonema magnum]|uniref:Cobalt transport protein, CbiQ-like n=1 Tax=Desulfonema magnum TaxID=45655 RepID=A0A975BXR4_9BACT|nr:cobalt ECF transporter T component CbiQ [Desulfonema magnum]QTA93099.1 Putative cobalt transport protein, CbiQ-like [Desulfonema magnum]